MKSNPRELRTLASLLLILCLGATPALATNYYVSPSGSDSNSGTSPGMPWQTLARASSQSYAAGDQLLLQGGKSFPGELTLNSSSTGTEADPVTISSYGGGRATIDAGAGIGVYLYDTAGVTVKDLNVVGGWNEMTQSGSSGDGIRLFTDQTGGVRLSGMTIYNCDISGFYDAGIEVASSPSDGSQSGYNDLTIAGCQIHDNGQAALSTNGPTAYTSTTPYAFTNVHVTECQAFRNFGLKADTGGNTGNGIVLGDVQNGTIERCEAYDNGKYNLGNNGGPVGIWTWTSTEITIAYNEAYNNQSQTQDGDGFDLDGGVTNSVMEYNYSHDNHGAGYLLYEYGDFRAYNNDNTVRYNISQNDATDANYGSITEGSYDNDNSIYGNTLYNNHNALLQIDTATNTRVYNNIFFGDGQAPLIRVSSTATTSLLGNDYWPNGNPFEIVWGGTTYTSYTSWRSASGQETRNGRDTGKHANPDLVDAGGGGTIGNPNDLDSLTVYKLRNGSPVSAAGVNLYSLGIDPGSVDFYGDPLPSGKGFSIGAYQPRNQNGNSQM